MLTDRQIKDSGVKFFKLNDCEVWIGFTLKETIAEAMKQTRLSRDDLVDDPCELYVGAEDWDRLTITEMDEKYQPTYTYRNYFEKICDEGITFPCLWSSTEY